MEACLSKVLTKGPGDPSLGVRISWHGHSCFTFKDSAGRLFLADPFDETVGYPPPPLNADALLVTHGHFDHASHPRAKRFFDSLEKSTEPAASSRFDAMDIMASTGTAPAGGLEVTGVSAFHDDRKGRRFGSTMMFVWEMGGLRLAHLGDIGEASLTAEQLGALGKVDVLFIPVGGKTTVDAKSAYRIARQVDPKVVVPMHYGNRLVRFFEFNPVDPFVKLFHNNVVKLESNEFSLCRDGLPRDMTLYLPALPK